MCVCVGVGVSVCGCGCRCVGGCGCVGVWVCVFCLLVKSGVQVCCCSTHLCTRSLPFFPPFPSFPVLPSSPPALHHDRRTPSSTNALLICKSCPRPNVPDPNSLALFAVLLSRVVFFPTHVCVCVCQFRLFARVFFFLSSHFLRLSFCSLV